MAWTDGPRVASARSMHSGAVFIIGCMSAVLSRSAGLSGSVFLSIATVLVIASVLLQVANYIAHKC